MPAQTTRGERKMRVNTQTQLLVVLMFVVAAWTKVDFQVCLVFVAGVTGAAGFFAWGNRGEHQADAQKFEAAAKYGAKPPSEVPS